MQTAIAAIFVFLLVILVHELGHFAVAKFTGIRVNEFSIGMGPKLLDARKGETQYTLRALPIGGYVKMEGEDEDTEDPRGFSNASPLARIGVLAAGSIMNFILAFIVLTVVSFGLGSPTNTIDNIRDGSPAEIYGLKSGDKIVNINNVEINNWESLSENINDINPDETFTISLIRNGEEKVISLNTIHEDGRNIIGITPKFESSLGSSIKGGYRNTKRFLGFMFDFVRMTFRGEVSTNDLSGPVGVISEVGKAAEMGIYNLLIILGFISINLGFFNLLPIPALDGSRLLFVVIELIRGKPIDKEREGFIHFIGFIFLLGLMLMVTYKDIIRINL